MVVGGAGTTVTPNWTVDVCPFASEHATEMKDTLLVDPPLRSGAVPVRTKLFSDGFALNQPGNPVALQATGPLQPAAVVIVAEPLLPSNQAGKAVVAI